MTARKARKDASARLPVTWPADTVERRPVIDLVPYAQNARTHSDEQVTAIAQSITRFGFTVPVLIDEGGGIIAGHGRVLAAKQLGLGDVPVMIARDWSVDQKRAYVLADNKLALGSGWNEDLLRVEIDALRNASFDLGATGFSADEIAKLFEIPAPPNTAPQLTGLSYSVVVRCTSEAHQMELLARFEKEGLECDALIS